MSTTSSSDKSPIQLRYRPRHRRVIESPAVISANAKLTKKPVVPKKKSVVKRIIKIDSIHEVEEDQDSPPIAETGVKPTKSLQKKKRWSKMESKRLKNVLKVAVNPQTEEDWDTIGKTVGGRAGDDCQQEAKKLGYESMPLTSPNRKSADFFDFKNMKDISMLGLTPDDSLLEVIGTPEDTPLPKNIRKPFLLKVVEESPVTSDSESDY